MCIKKIILATISLKVYFMISIGISQAFDMENVNVEVTKNNVNGHSGQDLLFTLFQVQPKSEKSKSMRLGASIRISREGEIRAFKAFDKSLVFDLKQHSDGMLTYAIEDGNLKGCGGHNHAIVETDADLNFIKAHKIAELIHTNKHDFDILENGNYLFNSYEPKRSSRAVSFKRKDNCLQDSIVQERTVDGEVVFEWSALEALGTSYPFYDRARSDFAHINSTDLSPDGDTFVFSLFGLSQSILVSRRSGETLGRLGNGGDINFVDDPLNGVCGQHQVEWTSSDTLLLFDNGNPERCGKNAKQRSYSRAVEYKIDLKARTAKMIWQYENKEVHGLIAGGARRLSNGNTIIAWGRHSKNKETAPAFTEVDADGTVVWEATAKFSLKGLAPENSIPRTYRIYEMK